jgi:hypothetical protein
MTNLHKVQLVSRIKPHDLKITVKEAPAFTERMGSYKGADGSVWVTGLKRTNSNNVSFQLCMSNGSEQMQIEFHNKASAIFFQFVTGLKWQ